MLNDLDQFYDELMPSLNIDILNGDAQKLPIYERLAILKTADLQQQSSRNLLHNKIVEILCSLPIGRAKCYIHDQFNKINALLVAHEVNTQNELRQAYGIDPHSKLWRLFMLELETRNKFDTATLREQWNTTAWNPDLPVNLANALTDAIQENECNPTAFNVGFLDQKHWEIASAELRAPKSIVNLVDKSLTDFDIMDKLDKNPTQKLWDYQKNKPCFIGFNPSLAHQSQDCIKHMMHHEMTHAAKGHATIESSILNGITACTTIESENIKLHPAYTKFKLAQEISADTSRALRDFEVAHCGISSPCLYAESYGVLIAVNATWTALKKIEKKELQIELFGFKALEITVKMPAGLKI